MARSVTDELNCADHDRTEPKALLRSSRSGTGVHSRARRASIWSWRLTEQMRKPASSPGGQVLDVRADAVEQVSGDPDIDLPLWCCGARGAAFGRLCPPPSKMPGEVLAQGLHLLLSEYAIECISELEGVGAAAGRP